MLTEAWHFFIDAGGTFTDVVARRPDGEFVSFKILSTAVVRGTVGSGSTSRCIVDAGRVGDPPEVWAGYKVRVDFDPEKADGPVYRVVRFDSANGSAHLDSPLPGLGGAGRAHPAGTIGYELLSDEPAPVVAIRYLMGLGLGEAIGPVSVRLGTTRATNALLERKGAKVAFVTTKGFGDALKIGHQDRPELFRLHIRKREEPATFVVEIDERLGAGGEVLRRPDRSAVLDQLRAVRASGAEAAAICLLHAHVNPAHEELVAAVAEEAGFADVSVSSRVARMEGFVSRGDTTVVDAYLSKVIRDYVRLLRLSLPEARLQFMTSNGGLVDADHVCGKDTILSGPAGGVVGCAHVASEAGCSRAIGFDMGGTSTDVCRIEPPPDRWEYQTETVKAGVRIKTPMLAVETVAAGGGSICRFDGQKLVVGPESAGADPGPACYGRGGPLTVTDMNVYLGRIVPEHFPFRLDVSGLERRLKRLGEEVNRRCGSSLTVTELAEGFVRIANANMAAAIKRISLAKGYDVREYALVTFGGAGGQHACAIADILGISRIVCSPFAGVLSAVGMGAAEVKRMAQRSVRVLLTTRASEQLEPLFEELTTDLRRAMEAEGLQPGSLRPPRRSVDVCYVGQASALNVPADRFSGVHSAFEGAHRRLYGYTHQGRAVEIRALRVELAAGGDGVDIRPEAKEAGQGEKSRTVEMAVRGGRRSVPLFLRNDLAAGRCISGPAVVVEDTSTTVIDERWKAEVTSAGDIVMEATGSRRPETAEPDESDPVQLELFHNQFASIAEQMGAVLRRTAVSTNVKERLDYSCAVFDPKGDLVANAPHIPVHLGAMSDCVKALMEDVEVIEPGDVLVTNDPYRGGSHLNDVTVITPVHLCRGDSPGGTNNPIAFFVASRAHHAEIGGVTPGSMPPDSSNLADEGVVIRAFRWIRGGRADTDGLLSLLTDGPHPSRAPHENLADIIAQTAANETGAHELQAVVEKHGMPIVLRFMRSIQRTAESKMRSAIHHLPDGTHEFEDCLDDGTRIRLAVRIAGERATFDFSGTDPVLPGNLNANRAIGSSALVYCLRCLIDEDIPLNAGMLAAVELVIPPCFLNPTAEADPERCPAVAGGNVETSQRIVDTIFGALGTVSASQGTMNNLSFGNERFGYYETICGGAGAGPGFHGADAVHTHMTNTRLTDVEILESRYPVRVVRFGVRRGSGGSGKYRGGCGVVRELEFLEPLAVSIISQRRQRPPYGLNGGGPGTCGRNSLCRAGSAEAEPLAGIARTDVQPGDRLIIETPGGGGYGRG